MCVPRVKARAVRTRDETSYKSRGKHIRGFTAVIYVLTVPRITQYNETRSKTQSDGRTWARNEDETRGPISLRLPCDDDDGNIIIAHGKGDGNFRHVTPRHGERYRHGGPRRASGRNASRKVRRRNRSDEKIPGAACVPPAEPRGPLDFFDFRTRESRKEKHRYYNFFRFFYTTRDARFLTPPPPPRTPGGPGTTGVRNADERVRATFSLLFFPERRYLFGEWGWISHGSFFPQEYSREKIEI